MATTKPRITVTLTEHQHEVLRTMSEASGKSMSAFLSELLELSLPTFEKMAVTFQKLKDVQRFETSRISDALHEANEVLEPLANAAAGQFDMFLGRVEHAAQRPAEAAKSPLTNRGVTPTGAKSVKAAPAKAGRHVVSKKVLKKSPAKK